MTLFLKSTTESPNYEYLNAVIRARGTKLLEQEVFFTLAGGTLEDLELFLLESVYGIRCREQLAIGGSSVLFRVENALAAGTADILLETASLARGEAGLFFDVLLSMADLENGRLLLRASRAGEARGKPPLWRMYCVAGTAFYDDLWKKCFNAADGAIRCHEEENPMASLLGEAYRTLYETGSLSVSERALYSGWLDYWREQLGPLKGTNVRLMEEYLGRLTDTWNLSTWFRSGTELEHGVRSFLRGGWGLSPLKLEGCATLECLFEGSGWEIPFLSGQREANSVFLRKFQGLFHLWQKRLYRKDLLGIHVSMGYAAQVQLEWANLSMIAAGLSLNIPSAEIVRHLLLPGE